jgi:hypothetical protein
MLQAIQLLDGCFCMLCLFVLHQTTTLQQGQEQGQGQGQGQGQASSATVQKVRAVSHARWVAVIITDSEHRQCTEQ